MAGLLFLPLRPHGSLMTADQSREIEKLLDVAGVAQILGTSVAQIYNMRARGQLPPAVDRKGLGLRWLSSAIEAYVLHGLTPPPMRQAPHPPPARTRAKAAVAARQTPMERHRAALQQILEKGKRP